MYCIDKSVKLKNCYQYNFMCTSIYKRPSNKKFQIRYFTAMANRCHRSYFKLCKGETFSDWLLHFNGHTLPKRLILAQKKLDFGFSLSFFSRSVCVYSARTVFSSYPSQLTFAITQVLQPYFINITRSQLFFIHQHTKTISILLTC